MADELADIVPRDGGALAVPTDITSSEDVGALTERCAPQLTTLYVAPVR